MTIKMFGAEFDKRLKSISVEIEHPLSCYKRSDWKALKEFLRGRNTNVSLYYVGTHTAPFNLDIDNLIFRDKCGWLTANLEFTDSDISVCTCSNYDEEDADLSFDDVFHCSAIINDYPTILIGAEIEIRCSEDDVEEENKDESVNAVFMFETEVSMDEDEIEIRLYKPLTEYRKSDWAGLKEFIRGRDARVALKRFVNGVLIDYATVNNRLITPPYDGLIGSLSIHGEFGEISWFFAEGEKYGRDSQSNSLDNLFHVEEVPLYNSVTICGITFDVVKEVSTRKYTGYWGLELGSWTNKY